MSKDINVTVGTSSATEPRGFFGNESVYSPQTENSNYGRSGVEFSFLSNCAFDVIAITPMDVPIYIKASQRIFGELALKEQETIRVTTVNRFGSTSDLVNVVRIMKETSEATGMAFSNTTRSIRSLLNSDAEEATRPNVDRPKHVTRDERFVHSEYLIDAKKIKESKNGYLDAGTGYLFVAAEQLSEGSYFLHPHGSVGRNVRQTMETREVPVDVCSFVLEIKIVDNESRYGKLFGFAFGEVFKIDTTNSPTRLPGIYARAKDVQSGVFQGEWKRYDFDEGMTKLGLFRTIDEAESNGQPEKKLELERKKAEARTAELEAQLEDQKREFELYKMDHDRKVKDLQMQQEQRNQEHKERSLSMEQQSSDRKAQIETLKVAQETRKENADVVSNALKLCGIVVGAVVSIIGILKVFF